MAIQDIVDSVSNWFLANAAGIAGALAVLVIGWILIKFFVRFLRKRFEKSDMEPGLKGFLLSIIGISLKILLLITVVSMLGVQTTSFIAVLGAAGLAVGLALQGSLSNFAGGVLILSRKPFTVGEFIEASGTSGSVQEIDILYTRLKTPDGQLVVIPNGDLSNSDIKNYTRNPTRRMTIQAGIAYDDDIDKAKEVLKKLVESEERFLSDPEPLYQVYELGADAVGVHARAWINIGDYWDVYYEMIEKVKKSFDKNDLSFPYPQRDVHLFKE